jgi:carboxylesterase type B
VKSAGAGSVMHHLVAFGGKSKRLFKKAIIQSPGFVPQIDRRGMIEQQFKDFAALVGCAGRGIACLRSKDMAQIREATSKTVSGAPTGMFGFGYVIQNNYSGIEKLILICAAPFPTVYSSDNCLISNLRQVRSLLFKLHLADKAAGNFQKDIESIIITHVADEGASFIPPLLNSTMLGTLISLIFSTEDVRKSILDHYPPVGLLQSLGTLAKHKSEQERFKTFIASHAFNCHVRAVANAYEGRAKVYLGQYSRGDGTHASDLPATFHNSTASNSLSKLMEWSDPGFSNFSRSYQDYFLSLARTGDPNKLKSPNSINWPTYVGGPVFQNVLDAGGKGFELIKDNLTTAENCDFFLKAWAEATKQGGKSRLRRFEILC